VLTNCVRWTCKTYFLATEVLAKHDENYMPPEVAAALKITAKEE
jgi:cytochrome c-type biogenesis protein CcmE